MTSDRRRFEQLIREAERAPIEGWDFGWLEGRATEERPSWGYSGLLAERYRRATAVLDLQSGGGELLAKLPVLPKLTIASEAWPPNVGVAAANLRPLGASVVVAHADRPTLPFADHTFDLVSSRHPVDTWWSEIARVLCPGGAYFSQQVGPRSVGEVSEFMLGPQLGSSKREPARARAEAEAAGLEVIDLREERLPVAFHDVGAVVYFLRLVVWNVPGFTVAGYRDRLWELHCRIEESGPFVAHSTRFLIEARKR